jgi:hypothetical protein
MGEVIERVSKVLLVAIGVIVGVLDMLGLIGSTSWLDRRIPAFILLSLAAIIGYLFIEAQNRTRQFETLDKQFGILKGLINQNTGNIISSLELAGFIVKKLENTEQGFDYLCKRYTEAKKTIDQASLGPSLLATDASIFQQFEQATCEAAQNPKIRFRYLATFNAQRWSIVKKAFQQSTASKYYVGYYEENLSNLSVLSFTIIDSEEEGEKELIVRYQYDPSDDQGYWLAIRQPDIVRLFSTYYANLWNKAAKLKNDTETIQKFDKKYA